MRGVWQNNRDFYLKQEIYDYFFDKFIYMEINLATLQISCSEWVRKNVNFGEKIFTFQYYLHFADDHNSNQCLSPPLLLLL